MLEASVRTILKEFSERIPKQGRVLTYFLISWTIEVWAGVQGGGLVRSLLKRSLHCCLVLIEI